MDGKLKILYTIPSLSSCDGIASYAINYYRRIDHELFRIDFLINTPGGEYIEEIESNGDSVYIINGPGFRNLAEFLRNVRRFFRENHGYDIIHCHAPNTAAFYLFFARKSGIVTRILHSHITKSADVWMKQLRNDLITPLAVKNANQYASCTKAAGEFLFRRKDFRIINNAIDLRRFEYSPEKREEVRNQMNCGDRLVIGFIGRLCNQKNPLFLIQIFEEIYRLRQDVLLLIIGEGPLEQKVKAAAAAKNLDRAVVYAGKQTDVSPFYQAMDVFVLPSRYEGLGIVYIEAQVAGLPTFASTEVPGEAKISSAIHYLDLKAGSRVWAEEILNASVTEQRESRSQEAVHCGYDITERVNFLQNYYKQLQLHSKEDIGGYHDQSFAYRFLR